MTFYRIALDPLPSFYSAGVATGLPGYRHMDRTLRSHELFLVEEGRLFMAADGVRTCAEAGTILFHPGNVWQEGTAPSPAGVKFAWLHFQAGVERCELGPAQVSRIRDSLTLAGPATGGAQKCVFIPSACRPAYFAELMNLAYALAERKRRYVLERSLIVNLLLCRLSTAYFEDVRCLPRTRQGRIAEEVKYWLGKTLAQPVSARDIARMLKMNPDYVNRAFKRETGRTVSAYIAQRKMEHARQLLVSGKTVKQAAAGTGFADVRYFSKRFKRHTGFTPGRFVEVSGEIYRN
ncbi:MAG: helix-turn-helix transcriptional regulator [Kiritimatiellae bacterium]|nr:helix-turn-helix transcriptional regulator [Kiritimatiellia bacterium]